MIFAYFGILPIFTLYYLIHLNTIMKKLLMVAVIVAGTATLTSCKKEYTCDCTGTTSFTVYQKTGKGKNANDACADAAEKVLGIPVEVCVPAE